MALNVGTRLGHYSVTALIGEGGMGQVWGATDTTLDRQVARSCRRRLPLIRIVAARGGRVGEAHSRPHATGVASYSSHADVRWCGAMCQP